MKVLTILPHARQVYIYIYITVRFVVSVGVDFQKISSHWG